MSSHATHHGRGAVTALTAFPLAPRSTRWDAGKAEPAVRARTGADTRPNAAYADCFFWHDAAAPERYGSYRLLYCDVIDDEIVAVPRAIFAVAGVLDGARGGTSIPPADQDQIKTVVGEWYGKMAAQFGDASIVAPWAVRGSGS